jgi:hypothetical protein
MPHTPLVRWIDMSTHRLMLRGELVGTTELESLPSVAQIRVGKLTAGPAYAEVRPVFQRWQRALLIEQGKVDLPGYEAPTAGEPVESAVAVANLGLELHDSAGQPIATTYIHIMELPEGDVPTVVVQLPERAGAQVLSS